MNAAIFVGRGPLGYVAEAVEAEAPAVLLTPQQRKKMFIDRGEPVMDWARAHGFDGDMAAVYRVLNGQSPANRGKHHAIAVALGIKPKTTTK